MTGPTGNAAGGNAITVAIPVYNNGTTLERTLRSVLDQSLPPNLIHISDNASTDDTEAIGRAFAASCPTVRYTRQATSLGPSGNFAFLLQDATTPYFMWLAADDHVLPSYLEKMSACLDASPDVVTCVSLVRFTQKDIPAGLASGSHPLRGTVRQNLAHYLASPGANARVYGLHRTEALKSAFPPKHFHAWDWAVMAGTLLHGKHEEVSEVLMFRDETPSAAYVRQVRRDNPSRINQFIPLLPMTIDLVFRQRIPIDRQIVRSILKANFFQHRMQAKFFHMKYYALLETLRSRRAR